MQNAGEQDGLPGKLSQTGARIPFEGEGRGCSRANGAHGGGGGVLQTRGKVAGGRDLRDGGGWGGDHGTGSDAGAWDDAEGWLLGFWEEVGLEGLYDRRSGGVCGEDGGEAGEAC